MQILLLTHYFEPENGAPQRRWTALIEGFVAGGHDVHVIAPVPHYPAGRAPRPLPPELRAGSVIVGDHGGTVYRVGFLPHDSSIATRTADHVWVARKSVRVALQLVRAGKLRPDIVVATAPGLPTLAAGRAVARRLSVPLVVEMRDAWPDLVSHTPGLVNGRGLIARVKRAVHEGVTGLQRGAATVVTTTESFAQVLRRRGIENVHVIRNGTALARYASIPETVHDHDELRVLYMGTVGRSQGLEHVIRAASVARQRGLQVDTRVVGSGADTRALRELNASLGSPVEMYGRVDASDVFGHYAWADTTLVSLRAWEPFEWTVPSKLYELMATGKHVSAIVAGEAADLVHESDCGDVVTPGSVEAIVALWERLLGDRSLVSSRPGGRAWVKRNVDYAIIAERYARILEDAAQGRR